VKRSTAVVVALALLLLLAFLLHRAPEDQGPGRMPGRRALLESPPLDDRVAMDAVPPSASAVAAAPEAAAPPAAPSAPTGSIRGVVRFHGPVPPRKTVRVSVPECREIHGERIVSEEFVVDPYGNMQWAFVYIKSGLAGPLPPPPKSPVFLDQVSCVFTPRVSGVQVGQPLTIVNSDRWLHNAHALPFVNKEFNVGMPEWHQQETRTFDKTEVMIKIKCDVHPWMSAWVGVLEHPYFGVSNAVGSYVIRDVPPGSYYVEAWHEKCKPAKVPIGVAPGRETRLDFVLDEKTE
jgi:hypothetical protein